MVRESLTRPYVVSLPMVILVLLVPFYIVIGELTAGRAIHVPALSLDRMVPVQPAWAFVYGSLYFYVIILPVFAVREQEHIRRTVLAYLMVWTVACASFLLYPTMAPRPTAVIGQGFFAWSLRFLYDADPPYNCFPSIHVAHSFVSALTCYRVHRGVGIATGICALLIAISTIFTRQHYILDVITGIALAMAAYMLFLRSYASSAVPDRDRRLAPVMALVTIGISACACLCFWVAYLATGRP